MEKKWFFLFQTRSFLCDEKGVFLDFLGVLSWPFVSEIDGAGGVSGTGNNFEMMSPSSTVALTMTTVVLLMISRCGNVYASGDYRVLVLLRSR